LWWLAAVVEHLLLAVVAVLVDIELARHNPLPLALHTP